MLDPRIVQELRAVQQDLASKGVLLPREKLNNAYTAFRTHFDIEYLQKLEGEELLVTMKGLLRTNRATMPYWLEFKNDDEFPAIFGSIAGGTALKYGVYSNAQTSEWMSYSPEGKPAKISLEDAIGIAQKHRTQLAYGVALLQALPMNASDQDYARLQQALNEQAPDVSAAAWGHKYFSLLFPEKLDDYHVAKYQRFHLVRLLQPDIQPEDAGRYIMAGRYVAIARELELPLSHLTTILNTRTDRPYSYWRVMANHRQREDWLLWPKMREEGVIAIGWDKVGDLSQLKDEQSPKDKLSALMQEHYNAPTRWVTELFYFVVFATSGDVVLAMDGDTVLGVGRITGPYTYDATMAQGRHRRAVEWLSTEAWPLPIAEGKGANWRGLKEYANQVAIERRILGKLPLPPISPPPDPAPTLELKGLAAQIHAILQRKGQVILYGPPGTGKTFHALNAARELAAHSLFRRPFAELSDLEKAQLLHETEALIRLVTFHPGYGYEDFIEGYRPQAVDGAMHFVLRDGIFKQMTKVAAQHPERTYFLLIDEINRGDLPRIFGELLTLLESDKRGEQVILPLSGERFSVPTNVFIIGTMNTADRSIALLDSALRRRFGFIELMPDHALLTDIVLDGIPLGLWLQALNRRIIEFIGRDARNLQIGHAYLMPKGKPLTDFAHFARILQEEIIPLLEEYTYEDYTALEQILGRSLVDIAGQRVRHELFGDGRNSDLIQAILEPTPDLITTVQVVNAADSPEAGGDNESLSDEAEEPESTKGQA